MPAYDKVLDAYETEYADLVTTWQDLEKKAQSVVAVAGILIAVIGAFVKDLTNLALCGKLLVSTTLALLLMTILASALSTWVMDFASPPTGDDAAQLLRECGTDQQLFCDRLGSLWKAQGDKLEAVNKKKVRRVKLAQLFLVLALVLAATTILLRLWGVVH
ncbi:MAG TPA: hypothetical protein VM100_11870 [Longimicrobiales bacterium]|nr:hypothetical protein [Longimicrobiales bacterium]